MTRQSIQSTKKSAGKPRRFPSYAQTNPDCMIDTILCCVINPSNLLYQPLFVYRPYLFQLGERWPLHTLQNYMGRKRCLVHPTGDRRDNDRGRVGVSFVVLNNQHRPDSMLFTSLRYREIGDIDFSALDLSNYHV